MLHKHLSCSYYSFREEDFSKFALWKPLFWPLWPTYAANRNNVYNFCRGPLKDHSCEVSSKSAKRFRKRSRLTQKGAGPQGVASTDHRGKIFITFVEDHQTMLHTKYLNCSYYSFRGEDFQSLHSENPFLGPCDLLMQPTWTIYIIFVGDHPRIIPVKFLQNPPSGSGREVV